jgi:hypothetical protein
MTRINFDYRMRYSNNIMYSYHIVLQTFTLMNKLIFQFIQNIKESIFCSKSQKFFKNLNSIYKTH